MRLVDIKDLKVNMNGEELALRELRENENYYVMQLYKEKVRKDYFKQYDYYTMGETKEEVLSELDINVKDRKDVADNFRFISDEIINSSSLLFNESFVKGEIKLEDLAEVKRNEDGKLLYYKLKSECNTESEEAEYSYDEKGNLTHINLNDGEYELNKVYDTEGRIVEATHYIDGDFILKESTSYYENYEETLCDIGAHQNINRQYYDDKKRALVEIISDGTKFNPDNISGISTYEYLDNGDTIEECILVVNTFFSI